MDTDRPLFSNDPAEQALFDFYDLVPAAELLARRTLSAPRCTCAPVADDCAEHAATTAQALALLIEHLGARVVTQTSRA